MIRVLHVVTYMGRGGLETMIMNYYRHMDRTKVQFDFLVHRSFRAEYDDEIESLGGRIFRLPRLIPWSPSYTRALDTFFKNHPEYTIVHVHQDCLSSVALRIAEKNGITVRIAHSHSSSQDRNIKYFIKLYYKSKIPRYATELFACGKDAGDWMFGGASYRIVNNAIDTRLYTYDPKRCKQVRSELGIPHEAFVVGHVGRFNTVKNHMYLVDVFAEIKKKAPDAFLLLVGEGDLRKEVEAKVERLGLTECVYFTGVRADVADLMQAMDCFVFPSLYEGVPLTLIEAQASGMLSLVSTGVPVECDKTGLVKRLSLQDSAETWAEQVLKFNHAPRIDTREKLVQAGYDIETGSAWLQQFYLNRVH